MLLILTFIVGKINDKFRGDKNNERNNKSIKRKERKNKKNKKEQQGGETYDVYVGDDDVYDTVQTKFFSSSILFSRAF